MIWLLSVLYNLIEKDAMKVLIFLGILGFSFWFYGKFTKPHYNIIVRRILVIITVLIIAASAIVLFNVNNVNSEVDKISTKKLSTGWENFSDDNLNEYQKKYPVFIDINADWCLTCKVNENLVLYTKEIKASFDKYNVKLLVADYTKNDPLVAKWLMKFSRAGVPLYVLYVPGKNEPVILPEILTKSILNDYLDKNIK